MSRMEMLSQLFLLFLKTSHFGRFQNQMGLKLMV